MDPLAVCWAALNQATQPASAKAVFVIRAAAACTGTHPHTPTPTLPHCAGAFLPSAGICLNPSVAAGLMAVSSVAVVSNSLLLRASHGAADSQGAPAGSQAQQPSGASM